MCDCTKDKSGVLCLYYFILLLMGKENDIIMEKKSIFTRLYQIISKDTGGQNESVKLIIVVRTLIITMIIYSLGNCILFLYASQVIGMIFCQLSIIIFITLFVLSYRQRTFASYCILNLCILLWIIFSVRMFGWGIGVQTFMFVLAVFCFFAQYKHEFIKFSYLAILLIIRMYLFFYSQNNGPSINVSQGILDAFQILNSVVIFWSIGLISYYFSTDTQTLEGKLVEYNEQLKTQASIDPLTGLHNRRSTMEYLDKLLKNASYSISICLCDIDFFKKVNDTYGHDVGDVVLTKIAEAFSKELPQNTFASRWGGEEFLLIFPQSNGDEAKIELDTIRRKIKAIVFNGGSETFSVSLTYGLVEHDFHSDITTLLKEADEKLYLGKEGGRDQIVF